jgi:hypothetical protein
VKRVAGDQELHPLAGAQVGPDHDAFGRAVGVQHEHLERITEIVVIELVVADPMKADRCPRRNQKIQSGT